MDAITKAVLQMDIERLSDAEFKWLHDMKALANAGWAQKELELLKAGK